MGYELQIENAQRHHANDLAKLINIAGEGMPELIWAGMAQADQSAMDVGIERALRNSGGFSYTNARVCIENNQVLGMLLAYKQADPYEIGDITDYPEMIKPLVELEAMAPGSWYINALATYAPHQGKGVATILIADTEQCAMINNCDALTLICASENLRAKQFYYKLGFRIVDSKDVVDYPGCLHGGEWLLMYKEVGL